MAGKKAQQLSKAFDQNPIEALRKSLEDKAVKPLAKAAEEEAKEVLSSLWEQLLGPSKKSGGEMKEGEAINFSNKYEGTEPNKEQKDLDSLLEEKRSNEKLLRVDAGIDYRSEILHAERRINLSERREMSQKINQIIEELKKLAKSSRALEVEFREVVVTEAPVNPGKYHLNFFEWMFSIIQSARLRVEESANWISAVSSKRSKKDYWGLSKRHGTSFSLSGERVVATQVG